MNQEVQFTDTDFKHKFTEISESTIYFPKYREKYISQVSKYIHKALERKKLSCEIDIEERFIKVFTNKHTRDPFIFIKACDFIRLISKNIEVEVGMKVLEDEYVGECIDLKNLCTNEKILERRRDRLIGKNSMVLKALKMISKCHIVVTGKTVGVVGSYDGLSTVKKIVVNCMRNNKHPVYEIKKLIVKNELGEKKDMANEDWSKHVPEFKKKNQKRRKQVRDTKKDSESEIKEEGRDDKEGKIEK